MNLFIHQYHQYHTKQFIIYYSDHTSTCVFSVIITTQPRDVTVPLGGTAVFTCLVELNANVNNDDVQWDHMGSNITYFSTNPCKVINDYYGVTQLNSTLIITNVRREHVGPYQFVLDLNDDVVMSRRATLTVLIGMLFSIYQTDDYMNVKICITDSQHNAIIIIERVGACRT